MSKFYILNYDHYVSECDANVVEETIVYSDNIKNCPKSLEDKKLILHTKKINGISYQFIGKFSDKYMSYSRLLMGDGIWTQIHYETNDKKQYYIHEYDILENIINTKC